MFVYVVTSYVNPRQTERLVARLRRDSPTARIIVSHDCKMPTPDGAALDARDARLWLTAEPVTWGDATYLRSLLAVIERADLAPDDWLTILTGQDYPIRPLREYEDELSACGADMLLEEPDDDPNLPDFLRRYVSRAYRLPSWANRHRIRQVVKRLPGVEMAQSPRGNVRPYSCAWHEFSSSTTTARFASCSTCTCRAQATRCGSHRERRRRSARC